MEKEETVYLIPANSKQGLLIFGIFNPIDLVIVGIGIGISLFLILAMQPNTLFLVILSLLPGMLSIGLVVPLPNYHNVWVAIRSVYSYYSNRRNYVWKGWCSFDEFSDTNRKN